MIKFTHIYTKSPGLYIFESCLRCIVAHNLVPNMTKTLEVLEVGTVGFVACVRSCRLVLPFGWQMGTIVGVLYVLIVFCRVLQVDDVRLKLKQRRRIKFN